VVDNALIATIAALNLLAQIAVLGYGISARRRPARAVADPGL